MTVSVLTLAVFTIMNFVLGMMASVFGGILDVVAASLGVSVADAGLLNAVYSYGAAIGVPILLILFRKIERSKMLKIMLSLSILMTTALILAGNFQIMLIIRLAMGVTVSSYGVLATSMVAALCPPERLGRTMAILISGNAASLVIGVPLTRALSEVLDWKSIFIILTAVMVLALVYYFLRLPKLEKSPSDMNFTGELKFLKNPRVLQVIFFSLFMFVGYGGLYTYITPFLLDALPHFEEIMPFILVLLGCASFAGNLIGGFVSDRIGYAKSIFIGGILQLSAILLILLSRPVGAMVAAVSIFWVMSSWFTGLQLNTGIAKATENRSSFMLSLNSSCIQLGTAIGASLAGTIISFSGIKNIVFLTLCFAFLGLVVYTIFQHSIQGSSIHKKSGS